LSFLTSIIKESLLNHAKANQLKYVHINGIDNILCKIADPFYTGFFASQEVDLSFKIVKKAYEKENVGLHVMKEDGTFGVMGLLMRISKS
jgi:UDP-N-acetylglucosamine pyrophosphorylase